MSDIINAELMYVKKAILSNHQLMQIKNRLTVRSNFDKRSVKVYSEDDDYIGVPRYYRLPIHINDFSITEAISEGTVIDLQFDGTLRAYQNKALNDYRDHLYREIHGSLVKADTGAGKTVMAIKFLAELKTTTLVIVPKSDLMEQWRENFLMFSNLQERDIGFVQQDVCDYEGKSIVIGMLHSLCKAKYTEAFNNYFGCIIYDEVHRLGASEFSEVCKLFPAKYRLGLSAGMDRPDGMSVIFYLHLGNNIIKVKPTQPKPDVYIFNYGKHSGVIPKYLTQVQQRRGSLLSMFASNKDRIEALALLTSRLAKSGRQTVLLSERKVMLRQIRAILIDKYNFAPNKVGIYVYETSKSEKARVASECEIILATTKMLSEGTDISSLRAIVFATPLSQVLQPVGRIRRSGEGYEHPIVLDFVDTRYKETLRWARTRRSWYLKEGFKITVM